MRYVLCAQLASVMAFLCIIDPAGTECEKNGAIRLFNVTVHQRYGIDVVHGGLQMCVNYEWALVCHGKWGAVDAEVACRQLGLLYQGMLLQTNV